jgi:alginate O-acetyltransferase complex protein AlgI
MAFSSIAFLLYFLPLVLLGYHFVPAKAKNIFLLVSSILFYAWGAPLFIFVILGTTFVDFHLVKWMDNSTDKKNRRLLLILSLSVNLGLLFYFKYCNFFIDNVNSLFHYFNIPPVSFTKIILPIGISFYTFESLTYVVDVYRKVHKPLNHFWNYQLYIILFPKLIAGPIIRYHEISDQIEDRSSNDTIDYKLTGIVRFVIGLSKKVLIANVLAAGVDQILSRNVLNISATEAWTAMIGYTFQIYFDFSGYSDMAIGLGRIFGFKFPENFNNPYISGSISEFWRRWHITLGTWMKNYLYIPLGGNKVKTKSRLFFNLWIVFLASGFWHGASWAFIFWGAYHGFFLVIEKLFLLNVYKKTGKIFSMIISFFIVVIGWVFFRMEHIGDAFLLIKRMFSFETSKNYFEIFNNHFLVMFVIATLFSFITISKSGNNIQQIFYGETISVKKTIILFPLIIILMILCIASITGFGFNPFIYFRF